MHRQSNKKRVWLVLVLFAVKITKTHSKLPEPGRQSTRAMLLARAEPRVWECVLVPEPQIVRTCSAIIMLGRRKIQDVEEIPPLESGIPDCNIQIRVGKTDTMIASSVSWCLPQLHVRIITRLRMQQSRCRPSTYRAAPMAAWQ